jgi:small GTP-binding protein
MLSNSVYPRYRVVFIGNTRVGKTSILNKLISDTFEEGEKSTIGANFQIRIEEVHGKKIEIQIWDTAGQEQYRSLSPVYYRNASAAILVYDITDRQSFNDLSAWVNEFRGAAEADAIIFIVGNKADLSDGQVPEDAARAWADEHGLELMFTSAKTGEGVQQLFAHLAKELCDKPLEKNRPKIAYADTERDTGCFC